MPRAVETYEQAIEYLFSRINYERAQADSYTARDFKLDRMRRLLSAIDSPQERLPAVHIAGTKGKGSTAVMVAAMLSAAGERVGLFTSPHVSAFEERMTVDGVPPTPERLVELVGALVEPVAAMDKAPGRMGPTFFEIATALAWLYFSEEQVRLVVLEVGLGGRLDATNVCEPRVAVITSISRDHTALLGSTLSQIAQEKAGIIKPHVPVVSGVMDGEARTVVENVCRERGCRLMQLGRDLQYRYRSERRTGRRETGQPLATIDVETPWQSRSDVPLPLVGEHQAANASLAIGVVDLLIEQGWQIPADAVSSGMRNVKWPLRIEVLRERPTVVVDAAHNWASAAALVKTLEASFPARRRILVLAGTRDKDVAGLLRQLLPEFDTVILTEYLNNPRAFPLGQLHRMAQAISTLPVHVAPDPPSAWKLASRLSGPDDLICVTGSFFLAAEMRDLISEEVRTAQAGAGTLFFSGPQPAPFREISGRNG